MSDDEAGEYEEIAAALAEGRSVGFGGGKDDPDLTAPVTLRRHGDALIAKRLNGSTLGVFASLEAALDAIGGELFDEDDA